MEIKTADNFSYPSSAAAVVFVGHLLARAGYRLDPDASGQFTSAGSLSIMAHNTRFMKDTAFLLRYLEFEKDLLSLEITFAYG